MAVVSARDLWDTQHSVDEHLAVYLDFTRPHRPAIYGRNGVAGMVDAYQVDGCPAYRRRPPTNPHLHALVRARCFIEAAQRVALVGHRSKDTDVAWDFLALASQYRNSAARRRPWGLS